MHYTILHCPVSQQEVTVAKKSSSKLNFSKIEYVTKLEIGPDNAALPSMAPLGEWFMTEQPGYDEVNGEVVENPYELKMFKQIYSESDFRVVDIGWWSENVSFFSFFFLFWGNVFRSALSIERSRSSIMCKLMGIYLLITIFLYTRTQYSMKCYQ